MLGRFSDLSVYKGIFKSRDFVKIIIGGVPIPAAFYLVPLQFPTGVIFRHEFVLRMPDGETIFNILLLLSIAVNGVPIIVGALKGIAAGKVNVDELVGIAIVACLVNGNLLEAAVINLIMVFGAFIEEAVSDRARSAIANLVAVTPQTALVESGGRQKRRPIAEIKVGDIVVVKAGEIIPVDGRILVGGASVDESLLTEDPLPVYRSVGDEVCAGTLNLDGHIKLAVQKTGEDATIGRIVQLVQEAEKSKVGGARIVDRYRAGPSRVPLLPEA